MSYTTAVMPAIIAHFRLFSSASLRSFFYSKRIMLLFLAAEHVLHEHHKCQLSNPSPTSLPFSPTPHAPTPSHPHFRPSASNPPCASRWRMLISSSPFFKRPSTTTWKETAGRDASCVSANKQGWIFYTSHNIISLTRDIFNHSLQCSAQ